MPKTRVIWFFVYEKSRLPVQGVNADFQLTEVHTEEKYVQLCYKDFTINCKFLQLFWTPLIDIYLPIYLGSNQHPCRRTSQ